MQGVNMPLSFPIHLPRHAFSSRDSARAGDIWRCFQESAVEGSTRVGWSPARYREAGSAFVVRSMTVVHCQEAQYGETLEATTWVANFRRGILTTREIRLNGPRGLLASATQEWVHVTGGLRPVRASAECQAAFPVEEIEPSPTLPICVEEIDSQTSEFTFELWHSWMDPLGHANHPMYLDWCDEALCRGMHQAGLDPVGLRPVAERVTWKLGVEAPDRVSVMTTVKGVTALDEVVFEHRIINSEQKLCATAVTVRGLAGVSGRLLLQAFVGE